MASESILMEPLIPNGAEKYLEELSILRDTIYRSMIIPKEFMFPKEFSTYVGSPQYWEDLRSELSKKSAISWMEVSDE